MLSVFPEFLTYSLVAPFILRVVLGAIFINLGVLKFTSEKSRWSIFLDGVKLRPTKFILPIFALTEIIGGAFLVVGFLTQVMALIFAIITFAELSIEFREETFLKRNIVFYLLLCAISLSLLFSGAGFLAFDLPL